MKGIQLLETAEQDGARLPKFADSPLKLGLPFTPGTTSTGYHEWPLLSDLSPISYPGIKTSRDDLVVDISRDRLVQRIEKFFDQRTSLDEMKLIAPTGWGRVARFDAKAVAPTSSSVAFWPTTLFPTAIVHSIWRWLYWEPETKLLRREEVRLLSAGVYRQSLAECGAT